MSNRDEIHLFKFITRMSSSEQRGSEAVSLFSTVSANKPNRDHELKSVQLQGFLTVLSSVTSRQPLFGGSVIFLKSLIGLYLFQGETNCNRQDEKHLSFLWWGFICNNSVFELWILPMLVLDETVWRLEACVDSMCSVAPCMLMCRCVDSS